MLIEKEIWLSSTPSKPGGMNPCTPITINHSLLQNISLQTPKYQLEVVMVGTIGKVGDGSRFVAYDSLSILYMHHVGLEMITLSNPVQSSL